MKKINNAEDRMITFSKRRSGVYKKMTEISTLCGVEAGALIFSSAGKPFTYGVPSFKAIVNRFLGTDYSLPNDITTKLLEMRRKIKVEEQNEMYNQLAARLEVLKKEGEGLMKMKRAIQKYCWWDASIEGLKPEDVDQFSMSMEQLKISANRRVQQRIQPLPSAAGASRIDVPLTFGHGHGM
ncbi:hypothetical protein Ancab_018300 [Ancistrocladus abbreviatus]